MTDTNTNTVPKPKAIKEPALPIVSETSLYKAWSEIDTAIQEASIKGNTLQIELQRIACSLILHCGKHKDVRVVNNTLDRLFSDLPDSFRKDAMAAFLVKYGNMEYKEDGTGLQVLKGKGVRLGDALVNPWWKATKAPQLKPYNFLASLKQALAIAERKAKQNQKKQNIDPLFETKDEVSFEQINQLASFISKIEEPLIDALGNRAA